MSRASSSSRRRVGAREFEPRGITVLEDTLFWRRRDVDVDLSELADGGSSLVEPRFVAAALAAEMRPNPYVYGR